MITGKNQYYRNNRSGFTAIELAVAILLVTIVLLSLSGVLGDSLKGWQVVYNRAFSEVVVNSHIAKRAFDAIVRKSSTEGLSIDASGAWVEVHFYNDETSTYLDRYAKFYRSGNNLRIERGWLNPSDAAHPRGISSDDIICADVTNCVFKRSGKSVHMILTLSNGSQNLVIGSSAVMHN